MSLVVVEGLTKSYDARRNLFGRRTGRVDAVRDVSFTVERGETLALVGESGAGKSTTGRLVLRLLSADRGSIRFDGIDIAPLSRSELRPLRQRMQMIFQDPHGSLDPRVPIGRAICEPLRVHRRAGAAEQRRIAAGLLERVGMAADYMGSYPGELSGGQLQRVAIARALTLDPELIVCDEPVAALDVSVRAQVLNLMKDLQAEKGIAYLFISHDLALVEVFSDRVAVMHDGEIVEQGPVAEVLARPRHDYTKALLDAIPRPFRRSSVDVPDRATASA